MKQNINNTTSAATMNAADELQPATLAERIAYAFWRLKYMTRMDISRPWRVGSIRRQMHSRRGRLIPAPRTAQEASVPVLHHRCTFGCYDPDSSQTR